MLWFCKARFPVASDVVGIEDRQLQNDVFPIFALPGREIRTPKRLAEVESATMPTAPRPLPLPAAHDRAVWNAPPYSAAQLPKHLPGPMRMN